MEGEVKRRAAGRPSEGGREALVAAARELFAKRGYEAVSTNEILERAGLSKGAMYHHFPGKLELFEAVYVEVEDQVVQQIAGEAVGGGETPLEMMRSGSRAYLRESARGGDFSRINLTQARQVLGIERWRRLADERGIAVVRALLEAGVEAGELRPLDLDQGAAIYTAALIEAGLLVAGAGPKATAGALESAAEVLDRMLDGLAAGRG